MLGEVFQHLGPMCLDSLVEHVLFGPAADGGVPADGRRWSMGVRKERIWRSRLTFGRGQTFWRRSSPHTAPTPIVNLGKNPDQVR